MFAHFAFADSKLTSCQTHLTHDSILLRVPTLAGNVSVLFHQDYIEPHPGLISFEIHILGDILQASDDLSHVINSYKKIVEGQINAEAEGQQTQTSVKPGKL